MNKKIKNIYSVGAFVLAVGAVIACSEEEPINMAPSFSLNEVSNIMRTSATFSGSIEGNMSQIKEYGFQYSLTEDFSANLTWEEKIGDTPSSGLCQATVKGLEANERYYYRLYASTGASKVYSYTEYFQTTASSAPMLSNVVVDSIGENMARFLCTVEDVGDEYLIEYGIGYKTAADKSYIPILSDSVVSRTANGTVETYFVQIDGLSPATKYSFRPYAKNSADKDAASGTREGYGTVSEHKTEDLLSAEVITSEIADGHIGISSIQVTGTLKSATGSNGKVDKCGFCWSENNTSPVITDNYLELDPVAVGKSFSDTISDLKPKTIYYVRAYAKNTVNGAERVGYGETYEVTTKGLITPKLEQVYEENEWGGLNATYEAKATSIRFKANITNYYEDACVEKGLIWSRTSGSITLEKAKEDKTCLSLDLKTGGKTIDGTIENLTMNTRYYVRAYAVYKADGLEEIGYTSAETIYTQNFEAPNLAQTEVSEVTRSSAILTGGMYSEGNGKITQKGFCISEYSNTYQPELKTKGVIIVISDDDTFTEEVTGLKTSTSYAVRTYAISELAERVDTTYAWYSDLRTSDIERPNLYDLIASGNSNTIDCSLILNSFGEGEIVEAGFYWKADTAQIPFDYENCVKTKATVDPDDDKKYNATIKGLGYNTRYNISPYAKNLVDNDTILTIFGWSTTPSTGDLEKPRLKDIESVSSSLTSITVKSGITNNPIGEITEIGFIWLKDKPEYNGYWQHPNLDSEDNYTGYMAVTDDTKEEFELEITGLDMNQGYYITAYAKMTYEGQVYYTSSNAWPFSTESYTHPNFRTPTVADDDITFSSAVLKANMTDEGNLPITKKGFVVHLAETTSEPSLTNNKFALDADADFKATVTGLKHDTRYVVRSYATCTVGDTEETTYSGSTYFYTKRPESWTFNNMVNQSDSTSMTTLYYTCGIAEQGDGELVEKGFIWKMRPKNNWNWQYPSFEDDPQNENDYYDGYKAVAGLKEDDLKEYSLMLTGLKPNSNYYVRSYAKVKVEEVEYVYYSDNSEDYTHNLQVNMSFEALVDTCTVTVEVTDFPEGVTEMGICYTSDTSQSPDDITATVKGPELDENNQFKVGLSELLQATQYKVGFYFVLDNTHIRLDGEWYFTTKRTPSVGDNVSPGKKEEE